MLRCLPLVILLACTGKDDTDSQESAVDDLDGDGFVGAGDCDELDGEVNPDAVEVCDDIDNNCDGVVDDDASDRAVWFADADGDGRGDAASSTQACDQPPGTVLNDEDCDDAHAEVYPGHAEECDGLDNDCDGETDPPDSIGTSVYYRDADNDGHGDGVKSVEACTPPSGFVESSDDCDDADPSAWPGNPEVCDDVDNDCDGQVDPADADGAVVWYRDQDEDGFGDETDTRTACDQPAGYVSIAGDCNDRAAEVHPGAVESCDDIDNDCDGLTDPDTSVGARTWYGDADGDGYAGEDLVTVACDAPAGYLPDAVDCDDTNAVVYPGAPEVCDGYDNNCDGSTDPSSSSGAGRWYLDADLDTHGDPAVTSTSCVAPAGYVALGDDCDDADPTAWPGNPEVCDGVDNDCDGTVDPGTADGASMWYADTDADSYGDPAAGISACEQPDGYVVDATDCNDAAAAARPGGVEVCDDLDNDCDGLVDPDTATGASTWFADTDGDGAGDPASLAIACDLPSGYVDNDEDCDPDDPTVYLGAEDPPGDGIDQDCDGADDTCADFELGSATGTLGTGTTAGAGNEYAGSCGGSVGNDQSFHWTAPNDGYFRFTTDDSSLDAVIYLLDGDCTAAELACNDQAQEDNDAEVTLWMTSGQSVILVVDNYAPRADSAYPLSILELDPADCNTGLDTDGDGAVDCADSDCASAAVCASSLADASLGSSVGSPVASGSTTSADADWSSFCATTTGNDYTYVWTAPENRTYYFSTQGSLYDTVLSLWTTDGPTEMDCGDDPFDAPASWSELYFTPRVGQRLYLTVDGYSSYSGTYYLRLYGI